MPMIDVYAPSGSLSDSHKLSRKLAKTLMRIEGVPDIPMFRQNTAAFIHTLAPGAVSNVDGDTACVRVQVLTNAGALDRDKQIAVVSEFTELIAAAASDASISERIWVLLTEAVDGGWGLHGHAHTNAELINAARAEIAGLAKQKE
jgi:phenylpyruvate tautomerase PptA (4-oxalocrotonate tautomerase family)